MRIGIGGPPGSGKTTLPEERIICVETCGCPHTAIRADASINLAATFSPDLVDLSLSRLSGKTRKRSFVFGIRFSRANLFARKDKRKQRELEPVWFSMNLTGSL